MTYQSLIIMEFAAMPAVAALRAITGTSWVLLPVVAYQLCVGWRFMRSNQRTGRGLRLHRLGADRTGVK